MGRYLVHINQTTGRLELLPTAIVRADPVIDLLGRSELTTIDIKARSLKWHFRGDCLTGRELNCSLTKHSYVALGNFVSIVLPSLGLFEVVSNIYFSIRGLPMLRATTKKRHSKLN